ncbi:MAG: hypothetical protein ACE5Z5_03040 [Candidatus Bathyarchaeia archaeon]
MFLVDCVKKGILTRGGAQNLLIGLVRAGLRIRSEVIVENLRLMSE